MPYDAEVIDLLSDSSGSCNEVALKSNEGLPPPIRSNANSDLKDDEPAGDDDRKKDASLTTKFASKGSWYDDYKDVLESSDDSDSVSDSVVSAKGGERVGKCKQGGEVEVIDLLSDSSCSVANNHESQKRDAPLSSNRSKRKRSPPTRLIETMDRNKKPKKTRKRRRPTKIYDNVDIASRSHISYGRKRPPEISTAIHKARIALSSNDMRNESEFIGDWDGDWWDITSRFSEGEKKDNHVRSKLPLLEQPAGVPASVMITSEDEIAVSSILTLGPKHSDSEVEIISMSSSVECQTCERHSLHLGQIERLLENAKAIPTYRKEEKFIAEFIAKIKALLDEIEADADSGISIFYHECSGSGQFNPCFTTTKLIQVFGGLCQICTIATKSSGWKYVILQLFKKFFKKSSGECGVDITSRFSEGEKKDNHVRSKLPLLEQPAGVPASVMITSEDEIAVSSILTLGPKHSDSEVEIISMSSSVECQTCERHSLHLGQIERLLENAKAIPTYRKEEKFIAEFIAKIKALLDEIEADADSGISIFYHECSGSGQFNPCFTTTKLIQVFGGLCQICTIATKSSGWKYVILQLFKKFFKKSSGECGVIVRILHLATYELTVSRGNVRHDDHVLAVSFGLQMITTMMRNIYFDSRLELHDTVYSSLFLDQPFECHKFCIKRNCRVDHRGVTACQFCGLRFHKSCFAGEVDVFGKCCPACKSASDLVKASTESNLADIYSLVVEKGASPLQAIAEPGSSFETALHAAVRCNNYDLMSMLLFGAYLLLNCDDSLTEWNFPAIAWGRDSSKLTPFEKGIDIILKDMNAKPPTEMLLLLRNRGVSRGSEDIRHALEKRHKMIQVMNGMTESDLLHSDASMGVESVPVRVSKHASLKTNFLYVTRSVESRETGIRWFDCRAGKKKCLSSFQGNCTKEKLKKLHRDQSLPPSWRAYCNYLCSSKASCSCQIEGLRFGLEIFETNGRGLGLRTAAGVSIKKGDIICNYEGEIVSALEAKRRDEEYAKSGEMGSYTINLDEKGSVCIDATVVRSASAFINHSCAESNTYLFRAIGHHLDEQFPFLVFRAKQDIGELEELSFNYVKGMPDGQKPTGLCSECNREHCLCHQCTEIEHKKHSFMG